MPTRPLGMFTKNDYAYAEILDRILTGALAPGEAIPQTQLAHEIGVSTTPLREAVRRLAAEGFIRLEAHRDARVVEVTAEEAEHLYEVRENADPLAARLAAERRDTPDAERIEQALGKLTALNDPTDTDALAAHREFHRSIYVASRNPILIDILERLWDKADRYRLVGLRSRGDSEEDSLRVAKEHRDIADAVIAGDPERAEHAMHDHVSRSLGRRAIEALHQT